MKNFTKNLVLFFFSLISLFACNKKEVLDEQKDYALIKAIEATQKQTNNEIDIEALKKHAITYKKNNELGKFCFANAAIGYKLYFNGNYDESLIHLKKAESNLKYCDSISAFVYVLISKNLSTTDTILALKYIEKAINYNLMHNITKGLPYLYKDKSLLTYGDTSIHYLQKSLNLFDDWGDKMARCEYARWHAVEMNPDSVIAYILPYYDSIQFTGYAAILADAYLKKNNQEKAEEYIKKIASRIELKDQFYYYNARLLNLQKKHEKAYPFLEKAYLQLDENYKFMLNQRLGAINSEYDLLYNELQEEKRRVRTMRLYNTGLIILAALLGIAIVIIKKYKRNINVLEIDIAKRKERFNTLFEKHKSGYVLDRNSAMTDAMQNLEKLHEAYPTLTRTEICIIWMLFMKCTSDSICQILSITHNYYYQRKSAIYRTLGIKGKEAGEDAIEKIVKEYITMK